MRRGAVGAFAGVFLLLFAAGSATSALSTAHAKPRWRATVAKFPPNPVTGTNLAITAISCASPGNCSAVGALNGNASAGLLLTEKAGHWAAGVKAVLPANAAPDQEVDLNSISCASAGNCTAVGAYSDSGCCGDLGLLLTETAGHWAPGIESDPSFTPLTSVSCASAGNCTAVGGGLLFIQKAGHWAKGAEPPLPSDAAPGNVVLSSVSCSSARSCSAVGTYNWVGGGRDAEAGTGLLLTEARGKWRAVKAVMPSDGPGEGVILTSISCASAGNCGAIGLYNINIDGDNAGEGVLLTEKAGKWEPGVRAIPPKDAENSDYWAGWVGLAGVSCSAPGDCVAAGDYYTAAGRHMTLLTEVAGKWRRGFEPAQPPRGDVGGVSCVSPGNCTVTASYYGRGPGRAFLFTETGGKWARGVKAPRPANGVFPVSCASPGNCGAVGGDARGDVVLLDGATKPCVVPRLEGKTLRAARRSLDSHGCTAGRIEQARSRTVGTGRVISQTRQPGSHRAPWTRVGLTISKGR
jgi:hypothetical protein